MALKTAEEKAVARAVKAAAKAAKPAQPQEPAVIVRGGIGDQPPQPELGLSPQPELGTRTPDAAFFAALPEGFKPPRRADYLADIITRLRDFNTDAEKVIWLRHNTSPALTYLLRLAFCVNVEWLIPVGAPEYKQWKGRRYSSPSELKRELRRMYLYLKGGNDLVSDIKRQKLFAQTLEGLESTEVGVLLSIKDRTLPKDYELTAELVNLAFPGILGIPFQPKFTR
jgi:hypothetical protein